MTLTLLAPPAIEAVSLGELKDHLRIDNTLEDTVLTGVLVAASRAIEARGALALTTQQWRLTFDEAPVHTVFFPISPVQSVDDVAIIDGASMAQSVAPETYEFSPGAPGRLRRAAPWPAHAPGLDGVRIDFTVGYSGANATPEPLRQAVKMLAAHFYEHRESASDSTVRTVPQSVDALIAPFREVRL